MPRKPKAFGVPYDPSIEYVRDWSCPKCAWMYGVTVTDEREKIKNIVGFSPEQPVDGPYSAHQDTTGIFIVQCPRCGTRFWFHTMHSGWLLALVRRSVLAASKS